jgi:hypothetical protein
MRSRSTALLAWGSLLGLSQAACPFADPAMLDKRDDSQSTQSSDLLDKYKVDDSDGYMTSDVGGPIGDQFSLKAGIRGSTLLEDFIFRQKIQHFDHERVSTPAAAMSKTSETFMGQVVDGTSINRFPKGRFMPEVLELMAPSLATLTGATSLRRRS